MTKPFEVKKLSEYQRQMDRFENVNDAYILPDVRLVVRMDAHRFGEGWTHLAKEEYPYSSRLVEALIGTAKKLMCLDIRVSYSFIHGDEISLLFDKIESTGLRRRAKLLTHLASAAAVFFYEEYKLPVFFRSKLSELPSDEHVLDYFFWQRKVAHRNYYSSVLSHILTKQGLSPQDINQKITGLTEEEYPKVASQAGIKLAEIPPTFLTGAGLWWNKNEDQNFEIEIAKSLPKEDTKYLNLLLDKINAPTFIPEVAGANISEKSASDSSVSKVHSKDKNTSIGFRITGNKGAKVINPK
ncbi:MAG: tRNA(His) guanylyltransferase Thg1 family protein [bacterium]|nr:tRNA(His) guanylyltransferase Thg1 family protein [bacterium]